MTPSTITANFTNAFSDKYGKIQAYTVIIATDPDEEHIKTSTLPDWKAAQINPNIKAYQTVRNCSDFFLQTSSCGRTRARRSTGTTNFKVFEIGVETDCTNVLYCNGPLKQNTKYYVRLRAYTAGGYADTAYSDPIVTGRSFIYLYTEKVSKVLPCWIQLQQSDQISFIFHFNMCYPEHVTAMDLDILK